MQIEALRQAAQVLYGRPMEALLPVRGGWSADAYRVKAEGGDGFLKVYDRRRKSTLPWIARMQAYLPAMMALRDAPGLGEHLPRLYPTEAGGLSGTWGDFVLLLFDFLEGETPGRTPLSQTQQQELGRLTARLHEAVLPQTAGLEEDLSLPFCGKLAGLLAPGRLPEGLEDLLPRYGQTLRAAIEALLRLRDTARRPCTALVPCHTDLHGFNVLQGGRPYLLDWEGLCLAPPEADLFMLAGTAAWPAFYSAYRRARPGFTLQPPLLYFYVLRRRVEDLWEFLHRLLQDPVTEDQRRSSYALGRKVCREIEDLLRAPTLDAVQL